MARDPAEDIVNVWLNQNGYFTIRNIKVGRKEIDLLGIDKDGKAVHVEVTISIDPATKSIEKEVKQAQDFYTKKFDTKIEKKIEELLGHKNYEKWVILGETKKIKGMSDEENIEYWRKVWKNDDKINQVHFMDEVLKKIKFEVVPLDYASKFIRMLRKFDKKDTT